MSNTIVNLGFVPQNRGDYDSTAKYYKDNIVQFDGASYSANPPGHTTESPTYIQGVAPNDATYGSTYWKVLATGDNHFSTGEAVPSVGIDDEPTAGSTNLVQSGGAYKESHYLCKCNLSEASYFEPIINGSGVWTTVNNFSSISIPVDSKDAFVIIPNSTQNFCIFAFLKSSDTHSGNAVFAGDITSRTMISGTNPFYVTAPSDAASLWIMYKTSDGSLMPDLYVLKNISNLVDEASSYDNIKIDLSLYPQSHRSIGKLNKWNIQESSAYSILLPVVEGQVYDIIANNNNICLYSLLTSADIENTNNSTPSFVQGYESRQSIDVKQKKTITIPETCAYICFTSYAEPNENFIPDIYLHGESNIIKDKRVINNISDSFYGVDLSLYMTYKRNINSNNKWYYANSMSSKMLPVKAGDKLTIFAGSILTRYAFLTATDNDASTGRTPSYVSGYETCYAIGENNIVNVDIPSGCKYLFIATIEMPKIYYNNEALIQFVNYKDREKNSPYELIYSEDFNDGINKNIWKPIQWGEGMSIYANVVQADDNNWYADGGCMVLKLEKRGNKYYAPYISTAKTLAISSGRIEARIKCSSADINLGWCFWTFGQNAPWPNALEIDLYEKEQSVATQYVHYHYKNSQDNVNAKPTSVSALQFLDWHTIAVEWDNERAITYFDGEKTSDYSFSDSIYNLNYPQQLCFNIKCNSSYNSGDAYLFVDYVKVWVDKNASPITGFEQENLTISVGESVNINPSFIPSNCINKAFSLTSSDENIVKVKEWDSDKENHYLPRIIQGIAAGTATLTMTAANGSTTGTFTVTVND